jgi:hypothetical protein
MVRGGGGDVKREVSGREDRAVTHEASIARGARTSANPEMSAADLS